MNTRWRSGLGWGVVLVVGCALGGWLAHSRLRSGGGGLLPRPPARLVVRTTPEGPFKLEVSKTVEEGAAFESFDGSQAVELEPGDYLITVIPASDAFQRKRLMVHLSEGQVLALPVVLSPAVAPPADVAPTDSLDPGSLPPDTGPIGSGGKGDDLRPVLGDPGENRGARLAPAIRGRVADLPPEVDGLGVDREALARYVRSRKAAIQGCYERELRRIPSLKGKIVVRFSITRLGRASGVELDENTMANEMIGSCIKSIIRGWVFPFKPEEAVLVAYPFVFAPVEAEAPSKPLPMLE